LTTLAVFAGILALLLPLYFFYAVNHSKLNALNLRSSRCSVAQFTNTTPGS
jgi:hypothetical protein